MNEIVTALSDIANAINKGIPGWVTVIIALAPIVLTCITIVLSIRMEKQNKTLQKQIHNRDIHFQTRNEILQIFNAFSDSVIALQKYGNAVTVFSNEQSPIQWSQELNQNRGAICKACDRAVLLLEDKAFCDYLISMRNSFNSLYTDISRYISTGINLVTIQNARGQIAIQYSQPNLGILFATNRPAYDQFVKMCENVYVQEITDKIDNYTKQIADPAFMNRFKKYTTTSEI